MILYAILNELEPVLYLVNSVVQKSARFYFLLKQIPIVFLGKAYW